MTHGRPSMLLSHHHLPNTIETFIFLAGGWITEVKKARDVFGMHPRGKAYA